MKQIQEFFAAFVMITLAVLLGILFHGLLSCSETLPQAIEGGEVIDSFTVSDSEIVLYRSGNGEVFLLEYQKNWLLPRKELRSWVLADPQPFRTAVTSAMTAYPVTVTREHLSIDNQPEIQLRWGDFCLAYGLEILCFLLAGTLIYTKTIKKEIQKTEENHV